MTKTYVAISSNTVRDYNFILPLAALFWRDVIGFTPICQLVGDWNDCERSRIAKRAILHHGFLTQEAIVDGYEDKNVAQNVREVAAVDPRIEDDDWLMPADADLIPLKKDFYQKHQGSDWKAVCYYSNGDHFHSKEAVLGKVAVLQTNYQSLPTCHGTMKAATWRERYGLTVGEPLSVAVKRTMDSWLPQRTKGKNPGEVSWEAHMSDQRILTEKLCEAEWFPSKVLMVERRGHPPVDRLDRGHPSDWEKFDPDRWTDAHCLSIPDRDDNWSKLRQLVAHYLPDKLDWADSFKKEFRASYAD